MTESNGNWAACLVYYQDIDSLAELVKCLNEQTLKPSYIFIADNDSSFEVDFKSAIPIKVIKLSSNLGFAKAANQAVDNAIEAGYNKFILFSQDVLLEKDSCEKLITKLNVEKGLVFPTMLNRKNNKVFSKGGTVNTFLGKIKLIDKKVPKNLTWADGSCLGFDKETFQKVKGFSEDYFMYFEDVDFGFKIKKNNFKLNHVETSVSQIPNGPSPFFRSRNSIIFARKSKSMLMKISVTKRNIIGGLLLFIEGNFKDSLNRFKGIYFGWITKI